MAKQQGETGLRTRIHIDEPQMWDVVLLNDDFTPMHFVTQVLCSVFGLPAAQAEALMLTTHRTGSAVAGTYVEDVARTKAEQVRRMARASRYPLRTRVQPH